MLLLLLWLQIKKLDLATNEVSTVIGTGDHEVDDDNQQRGILKDGELVSN
jgi:hypothetical protein